MRLEERQEAMLSGTVCRAAANSLAAGGCKIKTSPTMSNGGSRSSRRRNTGGYFPILTNDTDDGCSSRQVVVDADTMQRCETREIMKPIGRRLRPADCLYDE